jgi:hypothetical protein
MPKKNKSEIKLGATVRLRAQSGEIVEGRVVHLWEDKSSLMVRVASGDLGLQRFGAYAGRYEGTINLPVASVVSLLSPCGYRPSACGARRQMHPLRRAVVQRSAD